MKIKYLPYVVLGIASLVVASAVAIQPAAAAATHSETTGGVSNTWTNYLNAGGSAGPQIGANQTVQIACKLPGFQVADGNTWWYQVASSPWNYAYYVSADPFYNNGATSGSLHGTPFVDPSVPNCGSSSGTTETAGGVANTWTDYTNAGGTPGPQVANGQSIQIACKLPGFQVADGNTWWYQIASAPWNNGFYVSADAFYNDGATSGSLFGTPFVDPAVPDCAGGTGGSTSSAAVALAQGPGAPAGYRYAISLSGFAASTGVSIECYDSVTPGGFYNFTLTTDAGGSASTASFCYSGDGPDHWVVANGRVESNHVTWSESSNGGGGGTGTGGGGPGSTPPPAKAGYFALGDSYSSGEANPPWVNATCDRSDNAWPYVVGNRDQGLQWIGSVACSGASSTAIYSSYLGQPSQGSVLQSYASKVNVVTMTMGGNDIGFSSTLAACYLTDCWRFGGITKAQKAITNNLPSALQIAYLGVRQAAPNARIIVVGYPRLFPTSQSATQGCGWLTPTERTKLNDLAALLDSTIKNAAHAAGFDYVSTLNALNGHELCTANSWVFPILAGPLAGGAAEGHPLYNGQQAIANIVQSYMSLHKID